MDSTLNDIQSSNTVRPDLQTLGGIFCKYKFHFCEQQGAESFHLVNSIQISDKELMKWPLWILICKWGSLSFNALWGEEWKKSGCTWEEELHCRWHCKKENPTEQTVCSTSDWTIWDMKKWTDNDADARKIKTKHVPEQQLKDGSHQGESGTTGAPSPRWVSAFYNWRLPHQECYSTEGSRHLYTPVGICIIASHLELVAINWITPIIGP